MQGNTVNAVVASALDGLALRQQVIAQNVANLNTPGYTPLRVDFEECLKSLAAGETAVPAFKVRPAVRAEIPRVSDHGTGLSRELAMMSDTVLRYQALIQGINKQLGIMQLAISEGRR